MSHDAHLIFETLDGTVKRTATFYCRIGDVLDGYLSFEHIEEPPYFPPARDASWRPQTSHHFENIPMPDKAGPLWEHWRLAADEATLAPFCPRLRITNDALADHIPDITSWSPFILVSQRARDILEKLDPEGSAFIEAHNETSIGDKVPGQHYHWILRNRVFFSSWEAKERLPGANVPYPGAFSGAPLAWQLLNNDSVREHLFALPFWGVAMRMITYAFNAPSFTELRGARLTGLAENTAALAGDRNYYESIGHIP